MVSPSCQTADRQKWHRLRAPQRGFSLVICCRRRLLENNRRVICRRQAVPIVQAWPPDGVGALVVENARPRLIPDPLVADPPRGWRPIRPGHATEPGANCSGSSLGGNDEKRPRVLRSLDEVPGRPHGVCPACGSPANDANLTAPSLAVKQGLTLLTPGGQGAGGEAPVAELRAASPQVCFGFRRRRQSGCGIPAGSCP